MKIDNFTFVVAVRKGSQRVANKNIRRFGESNLVETKLKQIRRISKNANILLSSDCQKSLKIGRKYNATINDRERKYCSNTIPMPEVYKYLAKKVQTKFVCYLHVTSPLLKDQTLKKALKIFIKRGSRYSSVVTVTILKEFLWLDKKAISYNPNKKPRSQDIKSVLSENFAINIITTKFMREKGRIISDNFFPIELDFPENIDIDDMWQFKIGNLIKKNKINIT